MTGAFAGRRAWVVVLGLAAIARLLQVLTEPAYLHPDALFSALEPAFKIVWGYGIETWEFREGLRSWAWPGLLAGAMGITKVLGLAGPGIGMAPAIAAARIVVVACDMVMIAFAMRLAQARGGTVAALATGVVLGLHPCFFVMGAQPLIEVPAAAALMVACEQVLRSSKLDARRALVAGAALGLAVALRVQLAPAVLALVVCVALMVRRGSMELAPTAAVYAVLGGGSVVVGFGALDWVTWGAPWASTIAYLRYSFSEGTTAFGIMPASRYVTAAWQAFGLLSVVALVLAAFGLRRGWPIVVVVAAVFVPHQVLPYRVWRFVHPGLPLLVVASGVGLATVCDRFASRRAAIVLGFGVIAAIELAWALRREAPWSTTWLFEMGGDAVIDRSRGLNDAYLALSRGPAPRRVAQAVLPAGGSPGLALLGHNVQIDVLLGGVFSPASLAGADVWIVPEGSAVPGGFELWWSDPVSGVAIMRAPSEAARR